MVEPPPIRLSRVLACRYTAEDYGLGVPRTAVVTLAALSHLVAGMPFFLLILFRQNEEPRPEVAFLLTEVIVSAVVLSLGWIYKRREVKWAWLAGFLLCVPIYVLWWIAVFYVAFTVFPLLGGR